MSRGVILHLFGWDKKFVLPFRELIHEHFADGRHRFVVYGDVEEETLPSSPDTVVYPSLLKNAFALSKALHQADKIILHGLFSNHLLYILALQPWLLKRSCWVIWGGDLYIHEASKKDWRWRKDECLRTIVVKTIALITTTVPGDYLLARDWYKTKAGFVQNLMYYSHVSRQVCNQENKLKERVVVQIGNSADPSNNHKVIIDKLAELTENNFIVYAPLSYGDDSHRDEIISYGLDKLGNKFIPLTEFMTFAQYNDHLQNIDVAIFNHMRQQGMGNIIALISLGKKVYIRSDVTPWNYFREMGLDVSDSKGRLELKSMDSDSAENNMRICRKEFSTDALISAWKTIFDDSYWAGSVE